MRARRIAGLVAIALACVIAAPRAARADEPTRDVALLPLDTDQQLDIYGQPVASAIARVFTADKIDVVVVSAHASVPKVRLIVDGRIATGKGGTVLLTIRIRHPDGQVVKSLPESDPKPVPLESIDKATAALAADALTIVKAELAKPPPATTPNPPTTAQHPPPPSQQQPPIATQALAVSVAGNAALAAPLRTAVDAYAKQHHRAPQELAAAAPDLPKAIADSKAPLGLTLDVVGYTPVAGATPMARAHVRVRVASATQVLFDRVIATDTIVGDKAMTADALAARVAAEVLAILQPHLLRTVPSWGN